MRHAAMLWGNVKVKVTLSGGIEMDVIDGYIVWKRTGDTTWNQLIALSALKGDDGREIELTNDGTYIKWRYTGEAGWTNLITLSTLKGADGREIKLRENGGWVEWQYDGDVGWTQLYEIPAGGGSYEYDITDGTTTKTIDNEDTVHFKAGSGISITVSEDSGDSTKKEVEIKTTGGGGGGGAEPPELFVWFGKEGLDFTYPIPYRMKFTSQNNESTDPILDVPLNTVLNEFDMLKITSTAKGLVRLYGEYVE